MPVSIDYKLTTDVNSDIASDQRLIDEGIHQATLQAGVKLRKTARDEHRYKNRTGNLRRATQYRTNKDRVSLFINEARANYGSFVHDGTSKWTADKFIDNAVESNLKEIDELIIKSINSKLGI